MARLSTSKVSLPQSIQGDSVGSTQVVLSTVVALYNEYWEEYPQASECPQDRENQVAYRQVKHEYVLQMLGL